MRDVVMVLTALAFFVLCLAYVWWCDRIIGPDATEASTVADVDPAGDEPVGAARS